MMLATTNTQLLATTKKLHFNRKYIFAVKEYLFVELVLIQIPSFKPQDGQLVTFFLSLRILYLHVITLSVSRS